MGTAWRFVISAVVIAPSVWTVARTHAQPLPTPPSPAPTSTVGPYRRVFLPAVDLHRPIPALRLRAEAPRLGGMAGGIAFVDGGVWQVQGSSLLYWQRTGNSDSWIIVGRRNLSTSGDVAFDTTQVIPCDGGAYVFYQYHDPLNFNGPAWLNSPAWLNGPAWRVAKAFNDGTSQSIGYSDVASGYGQTATAFAFIADTVIVAYEKNSGERFLEQFKVRINVPIDPFPPSIARMSLPGRVSKLLAMPDTNQLLAMMDVSGSSELWIWNLFNRRPTGNPLRLTGYSGELVRTPDGVAIVQGERVSVLPVRNGRLSPYDRQELWLQERATAADGQVFAITDGIGAVVWVAGQLCLFTGTDESRRTFRRVHHNMLGCYDLTPVATPGIQPIRRLVAADLTMDLAPQLSASEDSVFLSRGSLGGFEVMGPLDGEAVSRTVDSPGGAIHTVLRNGDQLITAEGDLQLRTWALDPGTNGDPESLARLGLSNARSMITRDLAGNGIDDAEVILFRGDSIGYSGQWQRVRVSAKGELRPLPPSPNPDVPGLLWSARSAGDLFWSLASFLGGPSVWPAWRLDPDQGLSPEPLTTLSDQVVDSALVDPIQILAAGSSGVIVLDENNQILGQLGLERPAVAVAVDARMAPGRAWVATGAGPHDAPIHRDHAGLHCIDISDPVHPRLVGSIDLPDVKVDRLRSAGGRLLAGGQRRRGVNDRSFFDPFLASIEADSCADPVIEGITDRTTLPRHLAPLDEDASFSWDLSADGQRLYAARTGLGVYRLDIQPLRA